jgi:hypothetical protein
MKPPLASRSSEAPDLVAARLQRDGPASWERSSSRPSNYKLPYYRRRTIRTPRAGLQATKEGGGSSWFCTRLGDISRQRVASQQLRARQLVAVSSVEPDSSVEDHFIYANQLARTLPNCWLPTAHSGTQQEFDRQRCFALPGWPLFERLCRYTEVWESGKMPFYGYWSSKMRHYASVGEDARLLQRMKYMRDK